MNQSKSPTGNHSSLFSRFFFGRLWSWSSSFFNSLVTWITPNPIVYPENEAGELLRRAMMPQSWFDRLSAQWSGQPLEVKFSVFVGVGLFFGLAGLFSGMAGLLSLSALTVAIGIHLGLVFHHVQRITHALKMTKESQTLIDDLEECKQEMDASVDKTQELLNELRPHSDCIKHSAQHIERNTETLHAATNQIQKEQEMLTHSAQALESEQGEVITEFKKAQVTFRQVDKAAETTVLHAKRIKKEAVRFNQSINEIQKTQEDYLQSAQKFAYFIHQQMGTEPSLVDESFGGQKKHPIELSTQHASIKGGQAVSKADIVCVEEHLARQNQYLIDCDDELKVFDAQLAVHDRLLDEENGALEELDGYINTGVDESESTEALLLAQSTQLNIEDKILVGLDEDLKELREDILSFDAELEKQDSFLAKVLSPSSDSNENKLPMTGALVRSQEEFPVSCDIQKNLDECVALNALSVVLNQKEERLYLEKEAGALINKRISHDMVLRIEKRKRIDEAFTARDALLRLDEQELNGWDERIEQRRKKRTVFNEVLVARDTQTGRNEDWLQALDERISSRAKKRKAFDEVRHVHGVQEQADRNTESVLNESALSRVQNGRAINVTRQENETCPSEEIKENSVYRFYQPRPNFVADEIAENELFIARLCDG